MSALSAQLPPAVQVALDEADRCVAEAREAFARVGQVQMEVEKVANEFPEQAARLGVRAGELAFRQTGSLVAGIEYGVLAVGVAAAVGAVGYLHGQWKKFRCEQLLAEILEQKQALAKSRQAALTAMRPTLERALSTISGALVRDAEFVLPPERYPLGVEALHGLDRLFASRVKTSQALDALRYIDAEMNAWLSGKHHSFSIRPSSQDAYVETLALVLDAGPRISDGTVPLFDRVTNGRLFLLRQGAVETLGVVETQGFSTAVAPRKDLRRLARSLAGHRIRSWFSPWARAQQRFREFDRLLLKPVVAVSSVASRVLATVAVVVVAVPVCTVFAIGRSNVAAAIDHPDACHEVPLGWSARLVAGAYREELDGRRARCAQTRADEESRRLAARAAEECQEFIEWASSPRGSEECPVRLSAGQTELFGRLRDPSAKLIAADLQTSRPDLPCANAPNGDAVWRALVTRAADSPQAWAETQDVASDFDLSGSPLPAETRTALKRRTRELAIQLSRSRRNSALEAQVRRLCVLASSVDAADDRCRRLLSRR